MKKLLFILLVFPFFVNGQVKETVKMIVDGNVGSPQAPNQKLDVKPDPVKAQEAVTNLAKYYDISEEGALYPKGTFPRKTDTVKVLVIYSTLDKVTGEDGDEFTSPKVLQKVMYVVNKKNSFTLMDYLDENKKPITKNLIIWQTKEYPK